MKKSTVAAGALVLAMAMMPVIVACGGSAPAAGRPPSVQPTPTPVPAQVRELATLFVRQYQGINQDWDKLNADLDQWRAGLIACDRAAGQMALDGFAARSNQITDGARKLPRLPVVRDLADRLVQAAEREETSLRQLRDGWQPANSGAYQAVETELAATARLRQEVEDGINDLQIQVDPTVQPAVKEFSSALQAVNGSWNGVHRNFDTFRTLKGPEAVDRLNQVIVGLSEVVAGVQGLPLSAATSQWAWALSEAISSEEQAMRKLREPEAKEDAKALAAADAQVLNGNAVRSRVQRQVVSVLNTPADNKVAVADFRKQYDSLAGGWDQSLQNYHRWRYGGGGCDGSKAIQALDQLVGRSATLAGRAQGLPSAPLLRALREPLSEAAVQQAEAMKALRASWRPYATEAYKALDQGLSSAADRRRQVAVGVQDLQARLTVPAQ